MPRAVAVQADVHDSLSLSGQSHSAAPGTTQSPGLRIGNQAMLRRLRAVTPRLQRKLSIGAVDDPLETEADRVADHVMRLPDPARRGEDETGTGRPTHEPPGIEGLRRSTAGASQTTALSAAPAIVNDVLGTPGEALDQSSQKFFGSRFKHDFSGVRIHTDSRAADSAEAVQALAYAVGNHVVFGQQNYAPQTGRGRKLLAHELTHVVQQGGALPSHGRSGGVIAPAPTQVARDPKPDAKSEDADQPEAPVDKFKGLPVSEVVISKARSRVGFHIPSGMLLGNVDTDLKVGTYEIKPDLTKQQWVVTGPGVKSGQRFSIDLTEANANPWTLSYPAKLPLIVGAGSSDTPKTYGDSINPTTGEQKDPLWLYEGWGNAGPPAPVADEDDYETISIEKATVTPGETGAKMQAPVYVVHYRDKTEKRYVYGELSLKMKAQLAPIFLKADEEFTLFTLQTFPMWWSIVSITPLVKMTPAGARPYIPKRVPLAPVEPIGVAPEAPAVPGAGAGATGPLPGVAGEPVVPAVPATPEAAPVAAPAGAAADSAVVSMFQKNSGPGVAYGAEAATRMKAQGLTGAKILKPMVAELNGNSNLAPIDKATAIQTACNKQASFGAGPVATMPDKSLVVTSRQAMANAPVVIVGESGSVTLGKADIANVYDASGKLVTGFNVSNVRPNP